MPPARIIDLCAEECPALPHLIESPELPAGVQLTRPPADHQDVVLPAPALRFVAELPRRFDPERQRLLADRSARQARKVPGVARGEVWLRGTVLLHHELELEGTGTRVRLTEDGWVRNPIFRVMMYAFGPHRTLDGYLRQETIRGTEVYSFTDEFIWRDGRWQATGSRTTRVR